MRVRSEHGNEMREHGHGVREKVGFRVSVSVRVNTCADTHVDRSFTPHSHHEHPRPLTPARKPHLVLGQGGGEDQGDGGGEVHEESDEGEGEGNGDRNKQA